MKTKAFIILLAGLEFFISCRPDNEKCACPQPPLPNQGKLDSAFYLNSLQMKAVASIHSNPSGAEVFLDEVEIGTTPFDGIKLMPGKHKLKFTAGGKYEVITFDTTISFDSGYTAYSIAFKDQLNRR